MAAGDQSSRVSQRRNDMSEEATKDTITATAEDLWLDERISRIRAAGLLFDLDDVRRHLKEAIEFGRSQTPAPAKREKRGKFVPPTVEEVAAYIRYLRCDIDPNSFIDHYTANDWKQGSPGRPIKDWRACLRTWKQRRDSGLFTRAGNGSAARRQDQADSQRFRGTATPIDGQDDDRRSEAS